MDLLATIRKEGSRGGTGDFKWSDVQASTRRENYLGHSVMAPVGRWQKGRDLNWYAKSENNAPDGEDPEARAARERKDEIRRVKEAEEDAMARALGLPVPDRSNPNMQALGDKKEVDRILKESTVTDRDDAEAGLGFSKERSGTLQGERVVRERIEGNAESQDKELQYALKEYRRRHRDDRQQRTRRRSRNRSRSPRRSPSPRRHHESRHHDRHRSRRDREPDHHRPGYQDHKRDSHHRQSPRAGHKRSFPQEERAESISPDRERRPRYGKSLSTSRR